MAAFLFIRKGCVAIGASDSPHQGLMDSLILEIGFDKRMCETLPLA